MIAMLRGALCRSEHNLPARYLACGRCIAIPPAGTELPFRQAMQAILTGMIIGQAFPPVGGEAEAVLPTDSQLAEMEQRLARAVLKGMP